MFLDHIYHHTKNCLQIIANIWYFKRLRTGKISKSVFSNGVAQYNRLSEVTRESKTVAAFRKNLRKEIEARNYNCQMAGGDVYMRRDE